MVPLVSSVQSPTMEKLVVVLPEAVGTRSVEILQSYTRGARASRLATQRPQVSEFACPPKRIC